MNYVDARRRFRETALAAQGELATYEHPDATGPSGEKLSIDVALWGRRGAHKALLVISGTHGQELFAGSAIQAQWMSAAARAPDDDTLYLLVHALNPYGAAHLTRTNENNVDLNRNFLRQFPVEAPTPVDEDVFRELCPAELAENVSAYFADALVRLIDKHGQASAMHALDAGQYCLPTGLMYGGTTREWSSRRLEELLGHYLADVGKVACVELHTGLGSYAEPYFMCFGDSEGRAARWWDVQPSSDVPYRGLVFDGVRQALPHAIVSGGIVEFGTYPINDVAAAIMIDRWIRFESARQPALVEARRAWMMERLNPQDASWQTQVRIRGTHAIDSAVKGLRAW